jgi:4-hydroxy-tetrahydrodipicolinate synthase
MDITEIRECLSCPVASIRTPFNEDGSIDYKSLRAYVDFAINAGSKTMLITQGDSLFSVLSDDEIAQITKVVVEQSDGRAMVCAATNIWNTSKTIEFAKYSSDVGADILMVLPPDWGHSCTPATIVDHYAAAAHHIPVMVVTNIFIQRGINFGLTTLKLALDKVDGIAAIKDDMCNNFAREMALLVHDKWAVIAGGQKQHHLNTHPYGCDGYLSTFITFKPDIANSYWEAVKSNDLLKARNIIRDYDFPYFNYVCNLNGGFDAGMHGVYELFGIAKRWRRKPYYNLSDKEMGQLKEFLQQKKIL